MNAQLNSIPETVTVTLTRDDIEAYAGESDDAHNDLVSRITKRGPQKAVTEIVQNVLLRQGLDRKQTRKVSRKHAELALCAAIHRMYSALHYAVNAPDPEEGGDADTLEMVLEAGLNAASTALELTGNHTLDIDMASEDEPNSSECLRQWSESFNHTGDWLEVDDGDSQVETA